jgi:hypothetical protein
MSIEVTFNIVWRSDADNWNRAGDIISESEKLAAVEKALSDGKVLAVEHRHYRGSRKPEKASAQTIKVKSHKVVHTKRNNQRVNIDSPYGELPVLERLITE